MRNTAFIFVAALAALRLSGDSVTNPSFEYVADTGCSSSNTLDPGEFISTVGLGSGCVDSDPFNGTWSVTGDVGVWAPGTSFYSSVPDGQNVAFVNDGTISQTLGSDLGVGTYTLGVYIGSRCDSHPLTNYTVDLLAGGNIIGSDSDNSTILSDLACGESAVGSFVLDTLIINVTYGNAYLGDPLEILLSATDNGDMGPGDDYQADFDDVSLDFTGTSSVPEPSSWLLTATGLAFILRRLARSR